MYKATKFGAGNRGPVMDMFWGGRCGTVVDADGHTWTVGMHKTELSPTEMQEAMLQTMKRQLTGTDTGA